jgi:hypothetical protein
VVANIWSRRTHLSRLEVEKMQSKLCDVFDKLHLRIVTNTEVKEMGKDFTLGYIERTTKRRKDLGNCHIHFLCQNQVLIACVPKIIYSTHTDQKCSHKAKCHK